MSKKLLFGVLTGILLYTRFAGLSWGLPYPMHPDERNMAVAIQSLRCDTGINGTCLNPHFFAYGQLPLYISYFAVKSAHFVTNTGADITFEEATLALRLLSAFASVATVYVLLRITELAFFHQEKKRHGAFSFDIPFPFLAAALLLFTFAPYAVQMSHFGTTESLLMLFYSLIVYLSCLYTAKTSRGNRILPLLALVTGAAVATKISSLVFLAVPAGVMLLKRKKTPLLILKDLALFVPVFIGASVLLSPYNVISYPEFSASLAYESSIGLGTYVAFYTRQFIGTAPVLFQLKHIFPYALGWVPYAMALCALILLPWKNRFLNIIRFAFLVYFLPTSFLFAKWTRFMAPVFPLASVLAVRLLAHIFQRPRRLLALVLLIASILPGAAYMTVYQREDIRFEASRWIYSHIPAQSKILSESANVIDIPVPPPGYGGTVPSYQYASFDFYNLDADPRLQAQLTRYIDSADYIIVPTRRVFANHPARLFPKTAQYYEDLFAGKLGFEEVAEFANPYIGKTDENAEETWSVFDHPVIRIYKRNPNMTPHEAKEDLEKLKTYEQTAFDLEGRSYRLLVADTPEKQEQGLMFVRSKKDIGGLDGMIFMFPDTSVRYFWNKNTVADLDLYWVRDNEAVGSLILPSIEKSKTVTTVSSPSKVNKVIEIIR